MPKGNAGKWTVSEMLGDQAVVRAEAEELAQAERTFVRAFKTPEARAEFVRDNGLAEVAAAQGTILDWTGEHEKGLGYAVYVEKPKGWKPPKGGRRR